MMRNLALAVGLVLATAPRALAGDHVGGARDGEVRAVSVMSAAGKVEIVIDLQGAVDVRDFTLNGPARLVVDLIGARLTAPATLYDGQNRGGVKNIRYAQFRPDVVRIVIDLDALKDYQVERRDGQVRVAIGTERTAFVRWSSRTAGSASPPPAVTAMATSDAGTTAATVTTPSDGPTTSIESYLAAHRRDALQSQAPRITVQWDAADIEDKVTAEIKNQPWDLAFHAVLESQGLAWQTLPGGIINVANKTDLARTDSTVPVATRLVVLNYAKATSLQPAIASIVSRRGAVVADTSHNALIITDVATRIDDVEEFVKGLDIRTPQVSIQAKIIFVDRTDIEQLGVKYDLGSSTQFFNRLVQRFDPTTAKPVDTNLDGVPDALVPQETFTPDKTIVDLGGNSLSALGNANGQIVNPALELIFSTALGNFDLTTFLQALERVDLTDVQAEPSVTVLDNRPAQILVGDRVPIRIVDVSSPSTGGTGVPRATVSFEQTGINLKVTPHVTSNRQVLMDVHAERSSVQAAPVDIGFTFQTQQAETQLLVADGETAVIAGLTVTEVQVSKTGIPFLVDLPILGKLFGFTSQTETRRDLIILITPHIIDDLASQNPGTGNN